MTERQLSAAEAAAGSIFLKSSLGFVMGMGINCLKIVLKLRLIYRVLSDTLGCRHRSDTCRECPYPRNRIVVHHAPRSVFHAPCPIGYNRMGSMHQQQLTEELQMHTTYNAKQSAAISVGSLHSASTFALATIEYDGRMCQGTSIRA